MTSVTLHSQNWSGLAVLANSIKVRSAGLVSAIRQARTARLLESLDADRQRDIGYQANPDYASRLMVDARTMIDLQSMR